MSSVGPVIGLIMLIRYVVNKAAKYLAADVFGASSVHIFRESGSRNKSQCLQNVSPWSPEGERVSEKRKRVVLNNAEGISSSFNSESSCCGFFFFSSPLLFLPPSSLALPFSPLAAAVFSAALNPGPGSVSMVTAGSKASAGQSQPGLRGTQHAVCSSLIYLVFLFHPSPQVSDVASLRVLMCFCVNLGCQAATK